jgi:hypothetical protein
MRPRLPAAQRSGRLAVSLTTWFFLPELGMSRYEVLSRSSACAVRLPSEKGSRGARGERPWAFLTSQHVTHPFRYPAYYSAPEHAFVHLLCEADVKHTLEIRDVATGRPLVTGHAASALGSTRRDVALVTLSQQSLFMAQARAAGCLPVELELARFAPGEGAELQFAGHTRVAVSDLGGGGGGEAEDGGGEHAPEDEDGFRLVPYSVPGVLLARSPAQVFAHTGTTLELGMCGGPVMDGDGACVGVVEGIVPSEEGSGGRSQLSGAAVFVEIGDLRELMVSTLNGMH